MTTPLEELDAPLCFEADMEALDLDAPPVRLGGAHRARIRSLSGMQKEALVTSSVSGDTWRLVSDEGPYLDGADVAPPPLAFLTTGMVSFYANEILALAEARGIEIEDVRLVQDNFYAVRGSALQGTMVGRALSPELEVTIDADADRETLTDLVSTAASTAPIAGLLEGEHTSLFKLAHNGRELAPEGMAELDGPLLSDPEGTFADLPRAAGSQDPPLIRHTGRTTEPFPDADETYTEKDAEGYADEQDRMIHVRGTCTLREDGLKHIEQELYSPRGSVFEFHSDEPEGHGGEGRAPDAATYTAAGIGLCFMTQFGRYAEIAGAELSGYRIVQDTHLAASEASTGTDEPAEADPVETHVFLDSPEGEEFSRELLDMSEQTCYLHALCRTDLEPEIEVARA